MSYLVTGGTGFLGKHFIDVLARRRERVYLLVRAESRPRVFELMRTRWSPYRGRILPLEGDVTLANCGLDEADLRGLAGSISDVFHLAALYDLDADAAASEQVNVRGTHHALALARALGARLHHVSSIAITGGLYDGVFREDMCDVGLRLDLPYYRTKLEAEKLVRAQAQVPFRIYRPGVIVGSSATGEADKVDGPYYAFGLLRLASRALSPLVPLVAPQGGVMNVVPVDHVARAMDALAHVPGLDGRTFHLVGPDAPTAFEAMREFARAAGIRNPMFAVPPWLLRGLFPSGLAGVPLGPAIKHGVLSKTAIPEAAFEALSFRTRFDTRGTDELLRQLGIVCPPLSSYASRLFQYWERTLAPPAPGRRTRPLQPAGAALRDRRVLITGASDGVGRALALRVAAEGATVLLLARRAEALDEVRAAIAEAGGHAFAYPCDLTSAEQVERTLTRLHGDGPVDVLINNAGRSIRRSIAQSYDRPHDFERTIQLNYLGAVRLTLGVLPGMRAEGHGLVVNVSSVATRLNTPRFSAYVASKVAFDAFSRVAAGEVWGDGVRFCTIHLPLVRTRMIAPTSVYDRVPALRPDAAAELVVSAILAGRREVVSPLTWCLGTGYTLAPAVAERVLNFAYRNTPGSKASKAHTKDRRGASPPDDGADGPALESSAPRGPSEGPSPDLHG